MTPTKRKLLMRQLGAFSLRDAKSMQEIEKAKDLFDLMTKNDEPQKPAPKANAKRSPVKPTDGTTEIPSPNP